MALMVGDIINRVKNKERPITTGLGGIWCPPNPCRNKARTTTIRVKEVSMTRTAGRRDRRLIIKKMDKTGLLKSRPLLISGRLFIDFLFELSELLQSFGIRGIPVLYHLLGFHGF